MNKTIAALFVEEGGCYYGLDNVDPWGVTRDARLYDGPYPIVAHPPCERWGNFWRGSIRRNAKREKMGDDGGCFAAALKSVRRWGGVIEHPAHSHAWKWFGILPPDSRGGWALVDSYGGYSACVWQGWYGHRAPKKTWLYACKSALPAMQWGPVKTSGKISHLRSELPQFSSPLFSEQEMGRSQWKRMTTKQRSATPQEFQDLLISIARSVYCVAGLPFPRTLFPLPDVQGNL